MRKRRILRSRKLYMIKRALRKKYYQTFKKDKCFDINGNPKK